MRDSRESRLLLVLLVASAFALITVDLRSGERSPLDNARQGAASVFGPVETAVAGAVDPVGNAITAVRESGDRHDRISALERENAELKQRLGSDARRTSRVAELNTLLRTAAAGQYGVKGAQVVAIGAAQGFSWTITIDVGERDGITPDMTVLNGDGLVGRVTTVGPATSTVLLATDPDFTVGTRMEGSNELGFATGRGDSWLTVQLLNAKAKVEKGDRLVTFGSSNDRPFVPGVPVGEVTEVPPASGDLTRTVRVEPYVGFSRLDIVGVVVQPPREDPRDTVLPDPVKPEPTPTVTVTVGPDGEPLPGQGAGGDGLEGQGGQNGPAPDTTAPGALGRDTQEVAGEADPGDQGTD
ncbi:rod shape-determining protein MreC [Streptomyces sp. TRM 70351]|uniref:rod shape-determining protein MreC n=1 Tax=Streptomyces sp. TRM 70351 TaxID=3116552 RepID=UPI002E7AD8A7|nr:rod shape-determining protein MreC [Streptomyces sp. TRM 70351]MEE1928388.1 rod shape-determining protein MreC [Streptomyces sp. TRM 70351]